MMKSKIFLVLFLTGLCLVMKNQAIAQNSQQEDTEEVQQAVKQEKDRVNEKKLKDAVTLKNSTKAEAKTTKERAREANRINDDAIDAARQAKQSARLEEKAQRNRVNADKQARKARKAATKANAN